MTGKKGYHTIPEECCRMRSPIIFQPGPIQLGDYLMSEHMGKWSPYYDICNRRDIQIALARIESNPGNTCVARDSDEGTIIVHHASFNPF